MKVIEKHKKQLTKSDEFIKMDFNINRDSVPLKKNIYIYIYIYILSEWAYEFDGIEYQINSNKLIYNIKTEGCSLKDFRGYRNPLQFFIISGW